MGPGVGNFPGPLLGSMALGHRGPTPACYKETGANVSLIAFPRSPTCPGRLELIQTSDINQAPVPAMGQDGMCGLAVAIRMGQLSDSPDGSLPQPPGRVMLRKLGHAESREEMVLLLSGLVRPPLGALLSWP